MSTLLGIRIETGDIVEMELAGQTITAMVLLATDEAAIFDPCDGSTPFVLKPEQLDSVRVFSP